MWYGVLSTELQGQKAGSRPLACPKLAERFCIYCPPRADAPLAPTTGAPKQTYFLGYKNKTNQSMPIIMNLNHFDNQAGFILQ
jgi:hypothetical protein